MAVAQVRPQGHIAPRVLHGCFGLFWIILAIFGTKWPDVRGATSRIAGDFILTYWETDDGMPGNSASSVVQSREGYLWIGTYDGLIRFDGAQFTVYDPSNTPELPSAEIDNLHLDRRGNLWCSTAKGMVLMTDGKWKRMGVEQGWTNEVARTFAEGPEDTLYITGFNGKIFRVNKERFEEMPPPPGDSSNGYFGHVDKEGHFWAAQNRFTGYWDGKEWIRIAADLGPDQTEFGAGPARDGGLWVVHNDIVRKYTKKGIIQELKIDRPINKFWSMSEGGRGDLWICSYSSGVYQIYPNGRVTHYTATNGLPHNAVRFVFEDREANFWVGTDGGGLMRVKPRTFRTYGKDINMAEQIVKSLAVTTNSDVFVGTHGHGLARFNARDRQPSAQSFEGRSPGYIQSLLTDRRGDLWIGSMKNGLHLFDKVGSRPVLDKFSEVTSVAAIFEDSAGRLWFGASEQVLVRERDSFLSIPQFSRNDPLTNVRAFEEQPSNGTILAANDRGLFRLENGTFIELKDSEGNSIEQINCIKALTNGTLWLGTGNRGMLRYRNGAINSVSAAQDFSIRTITSIIDDKLSHWWLGSNRGIIRVDPLRLEACADGDNTPLEYQLFTVSDGLASIECPIGFQPSAQRAPDGQIWFATLKGVAVVNPKNVRINKKAPTVLIESASYVDGKRARKELSLREASTFRLPAGSSQLNVHFTGLSFSAPEKMRFAYRLDRDDELMAEEEVTRRSVSLNLLPAGNYRLRIKAANNDGIWNRDGTVLSFTVLPFFWQTVTFRIGAFALLTAIFGGSFWKASERRVRVQREKFEQQRALAEEKARLASVLEGTSDLVGFSTPRGQVLYINPAGRKLLGLGPDEDVTGLDIREFYSPEALGLLRKTGLREALRKGTWSGETIMRPRGGSEILTSQVLLAHRDEEGEVHFVSAIVRDITEGRKMEETLRHSQKLEALGTLASGIAHDFNNVLSAIIGNIDLARSDVGPNHRAIESLNEVRKASIRARDLVSQILAFGRQQVNDRKVISLVPVATEAAKLLRATLPAGIQLVTKIDEDIPNILADASQMHQVVLNLCTNSWHAVEDTGGRIEISLDRFEVNPENGTIKLPSGLYARLMIRDNGHGMDLSTLEHIFEPFFTTKPRGRGTGLGLAVVHGIVQNHDGVILVDSQPEAGTSFQLFFPATTERPEAIPAETERPNPPAGHGERILYLDDEAPLVLLASRSLERIGYRVTGFTAPTEAIDAFRNDPFQFDVVVTDFNMPGMSGIEFAQVVLGLRPDIPVLLTSGYLSDELKTNARAAGVTALIYKPNTISDLRESIHRWLGEYRPASR